MLNNELYHWKYIKREKKNGKWTYTYDTKSFKKDVKAKLNDPIGKKAKTEYQKAQKNYIDATNRTVSRSMSNAEYNDANRKAATAASKGAKYIPNTKEGSKYVANKIRQDHAEIELNRAGKKYDKTVLGKLDKIPSTIKGVGESVKQKTKDILGYDERDYADYAYDMREKSREAYNQEHEDYWRSDKPDISTEEGKQSRLDHNKRMDELSDTHWKWADEYVKANDKFMRTPLGIYTAASDAIEMAAYDVGTAAEKTANKVKDVVDDAVFEVEYGVKRGLGIYQKRDYEYAVERLERTTKELEKYSKNDSRRFLAEFYQKNAEEGYQKAKNAYSGTPLYEIETGFDYVSNIFKGGNKKRKK